MNLIFGILIPEILTYLLLVFVVREVAPRRPTQLLAKVRASASVPRSGTATQTLMVANAPGMKGKIFLLKSRSNRKFLSHFVRLH